MAELDPMRPVGPVRNYAAEAGGKFERKLPHMNIGYVCRRVRHIALRGTCC